MTAQPQSLSKDILDKAKAWANNNYFDQSSRDEIQELINSENFKELEERFYRDLEFGTGGMRAILGQGTYRLNRYNIRKATQAVSLAVLESNSKDPKVAISYDSRRFSQEFAKEAASVFAANGIQALIYDRLNPVSLCSFAIRHHQCEAGVMVTASHNPPEYNGFKVFWSDGAQVTPPNDLKIITYFQELQDYSKIPYLDFEEGIKEKKILWIGKETEDAYFEAIKKESVNLQTCQEKGDQLNIVYTALHGTGFIPCSRALKDLGLTNVHSIKEQQEPDGNFSTVSSPNPENAEALELAVKKLKELNADIALGTDPDTDRVGVATIHQDEVHYLTGNQIGILMLHYLLSEKKKKGLLPSKPYFVKTVVTTPLQSKIAESFGVETENTLTGFKWICGKVNQIENEDPSRNFVFGTEESFGYLNHNHVRDKDGVSSIALISEIALHYKLQGKNLMEALDDIYGEYGFSFESLLSLNYYGKEGAQKISRIMELFRKTPNRELSGFKSLVFDDYLSSFSTDLESGKRTPLNQPESNVLGFHLEKGHKVFLRPSGTEPKIKFYIMINAPEGSLEERKKKAQKINQEMTNFLEDLAQKA